MLDERNADHLDAWQRYKHEAEHQQFLQVGNLKKKIGELTTSFTEKSEQLEALQENLFVLTEQVASVLEHVPAEAFLDSQDRAAIERLSHTLRGESESARIGAFRSRDWLYGRLWVLDDLHHDDDENPRTCTCGLPTSECSAFKVLEAVRNGLYRWEARQVERLEKKLSHGLPREHFRVREAEAEAERPQAG